jgi:hypothetical protein
MSNAIHLVPRDHSLLSLLELTPATASQIRKASITFPGEPFRDDRRARERMQTLHEAGLIASQSSALLGGGAMHLYRLTREGVRVLHPNDESSISRFVIGEVAPSRLMHAIATADIIVHSIVAAHVAHARLVQAHGDGRLVLAVGEHRQVPDFHCQFERAGKLFNLLYEIDNATEPLDSVREQSIRTKILGYELYQDWVLESWKRLPQHGPRPVFRVVFLTKSIERAGNILWLARNLAKNPDRRLCYASSQAEYLIAANALTMPILCDHHGHWQSLIELHPTAPALKAPVRLSPPVAVRRGIC